MAVMLCIVAIFYAVVTGSQGEGSEVPHGGIIFKETPPAPAPVPPPTTEAEEEPVVVVDLPHYTADEVIMLANGFSADCRVPVSGRT